MLLGTLEEAKGDDPKAEADYKKALQLDPNNGSASNNLAYMMVENGENMDVALSLAQTARRLLPDRADPLTHWHGCITTKKTIGRHGIFSKRP